MTVLAPIETRRAGDGEGPCPVCHNDITSGQRIALVRTDDAGHYWLHLRCCLAESGRLLKSGRGLYAPASEASERPNGDSGNGHFGRHPVDDAEAGQ